MERLHRGTEQCDHIEQRACLAEERLFVLNDSIQTLARLIDVSYLILISLDKEKFAWLKLVNNENPELTNPIVKQFFYRLELYLRRSIIDNDEKRAYIQALRLLQLPSIVSSGFFLNMKEEKKTNNK
ncbi:unnamed protein product [Rotaria sp. Silwood1]|nr:unnamed protein product [Rotaria sp. Silwood1]CAF0894331.1 unnamed protein product [Rotaria sp. Silwood1]CAF0908210.1 unnamed protein product [Rotaria sp. Silwood1]CAF3372591.1 unnamed protein product [Rotaria sp. Silwood1]CAF3379552.1 unnamed protein product [Rotaria sp. Silwood1]